MYLPGETVDEFNMDSPMSEGSEYGERDQPYTTTPTRSRLTEYNDRQTRYTTPNQLVNSERTVEDMVSMLQRQQGVLDQLLQGQQALQEKTAKLGDAVH